MKDLKAAVNVRFRSKESRDKWHKSFDASKVVFAGGWTLIDEPRWRLHIDGVTKKDLAQNYDLLKNMLREDYGKEIRFLR